MPEATVRSTDGWSAVTDRELRRCTVKIDVAGAPKGTGFFVAPGHVVTCAHVLESLDVHAPGAGAAIAVRSRRPVRANPPENRCRSPARFHS